jgi:hypothetical protein
VGEQVASEALQLGVTDYLQNGTGSQQYVSLANRISNLATEDWAGQAANRAAEQIHSIYDRIGEGYLAVDRAWQVTYLNGAAETLLVEGEFDYSADVTVFDLLGDGWAVGQAIHTAMEERKPKAVDCHIPAPDRWLELRAYPSVGGLSVFLGAAGDGHRAPAGQGGAGRRGVEVPDPEGEALVAATLSIRAWKATRSWGRRNEQPGREDCGEPRDVR